MSNSLKNVFRLFGTMMLAFGLVAGAVNVAAETDGGDGAIGGDVVTGTGDDNETSTHVNVSSQQDTYVISVISVVGSDGRDGRDGDVPFLQLLVRHLLALLASQPGFDVAAG